ncbi:MAG: NAD/FAD-binding protein [Bdellovibrio sp.]|nr:NAD/FAD-binding protein [Bdellovibrio sp.]
MSLAIRSEHKGLEWAGTSLDTVFAQRRNLLRPQFLKMLADILRFDKESAENLMLAQQNNWSLGQLLEHRQYGPSFRRDYLLPIGAAIWSTPEVRMEDFPAQTFIQFFINHRLLQVNDRPQWRTVKNGSVEYVKKVAAQIPFIHTGAAVHSVERFDGGIRVQVGGESLQFDKVVFATHAPITLKILKTENIQEIEILSAIGTRGNKTILHQDEGLMPQIKKCWSSWNVLSAPNHREASGVSLTYYINKLQPLSTVKNYFVSLNPRQKIENVVQEFHYEHPQFNRSAIQAQQRLPEIQGLGGVYYTGAWTRYGFHEDGLLSAVNVGEMFGLKPPWERYL